MFIITSSIIKLFISQRQLLPFFSSCRLAIINFSPSPGLFAELSVFCFVFLFYFCPDCKYGEGQGSSCSSMFSCFLISTLRKFHVFPILPHLKTGLISYAANLIYCTVRPFLECRVWHACLTYQGGFFHFRLLGVILQLIHNAHKKMHSLFWLRCNEENIWFGLQVHASPSWQQQKKCRPEIVLMDWSVTLMCQIGIRFLHHQASGSQFSNTLELSLTKTDVA